MICTDQEARNKHCCKMAKLCRGSECMAWVWEEDKFACGKCGAEFNQIIKAEVCHHASGEPVRIVRGRCGLVPR